MAEMSKNGEGGISKKLNGLMKQLFPYFNESDQNDSTIHVEASNFNERWQVPDVAANTPPTTLGSNGDSDRDRYFIKKMPSDRMAKYALLAEMAEDATIDAGINIHLGFALSVDSKTNKAITLKPKTEADTEYVAKLQAELVDPINEKIRNWLKPSCIFGTNYVRPYGEAGKGIVAWEASWDTLPINIKEYERAGQLAGFTSEKLVKKESGGGIRLAEPWALIPLKLDNWTPDIHQPPIQNGVQQYSLYDDTHMRRPMETQNYGRSILESSLESWCAMRESLISLLSSRVLASKKDRFVHVSTAGLDTARAAEYVNLVADQLKADKEASLRKSARASAISTVWNAIIPSMGDKGGVTIDTQTMSPDIQHVEDIMFHIKRLCGSLGIDLVWLASQTC
ncbi:phage portal protein [Photobacterium aphoticum]|uniref:Phage portal protein n=1 Tax=Photobacterium aphoticum TaxID=754436 RepID=A0A090R013_9GAMM|nr:phage portal protein [Photobacterium aphoticum]